MSFKIALAGKGGVGKTTVGSLIIRSLIEKKKGSILALDADPNSTLNEALGVNVSNTVGGVREDFKKNAARMAAGIYKDQLVEMNVHQALVEGKGFDLLVMGRGEGPGCYCYANNLFKKYIDILQDNYDYLIMDNEAGMEHLSRRTTSNVNYLLIVSDPSPKGILTASRIRDLSNEVDINAEKIFLIVNRVNKKIDSRLEDYIKEKKLDLLGIVTADSNIYEMDISEKSIFDIPEKSTALKQVRGLIEKLKL